VAAAGGNITDLTTRLVGPLYVLVAEVDVPPGGIDDLSARLTDAAGTLGVDITVRPAGPDVL
jgi:glycine cleavage system transcriptional repressor